MLQTIGFFIVTTKRDLKSFQQSELTQTQKHTVTYLLCIPSGTLHIATNRARVNLDLKSRFVISKFNETLNMYVKPSQPAGWVMGVKIQCTVAHRAFCLEK